MTRHDIFNAIQLINKEISDMSVVDFKYQMDHGNLYNIVTNAINKQFEYWPEGKDMFWNGVQEGLELYKSTMDIIMEYFRMRVLLKMEKTQGTLLKDIRNLTHDQQLICIAHVHNKTLETTILFKGCISQVSTEYDFLSIKNMHLKIIDGTDYIYLDIGYSDYQPEDFEMGN